jgi:hypothetical protein
MNFKESKFVVLVYIGTFYRRFCLCGRKPLCEFNLGHLSFSLQLKLKSSTMNTIIDYNSVESLHTRGLRSKDGT